MRATCLGFLAATLLLFTTSAAAAPLPGAPGCPVFPEDNAWNERVDRLPVAHDSERIIASIGADLGLHADFGSGLWQGRPIGIPITIVGAGQRKVRVAFDYAAESDRGPYPIPRGVRIEGGRSAAGDRHALIVDRSTCTLYELFALYPSPWRAGSGAVWNLHSNRLRPAGWTSADAAGLPILPGLARYDEVARGRSPMRFASPSRAAAALTSTPPATTRATSPTRASRRWGSASGCGRAFGRGASRPRRASCSKR